MNPAPSPALNRPPVLGAPAALHRRGWLLLGAGALALACYALAIWFDWLPWLRGWGGYPTGWSWGTYPVPPAGRFLAPLGWIGVVALAVFLGARLVPARTGGRTRLATAAVLGLLVVGSYGLQLGLLGLKAENPQQLLIERVTSRVFTSYFTLAASPGSHLDTFFHEYPGVFNTKLCPHCHAHPPGPGLFYWLGLQASAAAPAAWQHTLAAAARQGLGSSPALAGLTPPLTDSQLVGAVLGGNLVLLLAAALCIPMYGLARRVGRPGLVWPLTGLAVAIPGVLLMAPEFDQDLPLVTAVALYCALRGLGTERAGPASAWAAAAGVVLAGGVFFTWTITVVLPALVVLGLVSWGWGRALLFAPGGPSGRIAARQLGRWLLGLGTGVAVVELFLAFVMRVDLLYLLQYNLQSGAIAEAQRPYAIWLFFGPLDLLQFLGLPLAVATLGTLWLPRVPVAAPSHSVGARLAPLLARLNIYAILFWGILLTVDLGGRTKAEQGRILLFLAPFALLAVYAWTGRTQAGRRLPAVLFCAQMVVAVVIGARWFVP